MERGEIDAGLAARLVAEQFPRWAHLPVVEVERPGWDNRTFRLGATMSVRLPSAERYAGAVAKEQQWLPRLAPALPVPVPVPLAAGRPSAFYPWPWSVRGWLPGSPAGEVGTGFARQLAGFLLALQGIDPTGGPPAGRQSFYRGADLGVYDTETRAALDRLGERVDAAAALEVWTAARRASWTGPPVWFHGDVAAGNLLVDGDRLCAVIDFGTCGVGDPACDLVIAWTLLDHDARAAFREHVAASEATWTRARGWALWKALITAAQGGDEVAVDEALRTVGRVIADHRAACPSPSTGCSSRPRTAC